jgi:hypothetical protein
LNLDPPNLTNFVNEQNVVIGIKSTYQTEAIRILREDFILCPYKMMLNFPYLKRFFLPHLPLTGDKVFSNQPTNVRFIVHNDALIFALEVNHEGHDYTLSHMDHLVWAK